MRWCNPSSIASSENIGQSEMTWTWDIGYIYIYMNCARGIHPVEQNAQKYNDDGESIQPLQDPTGTIWVWLKKGISCANPAERTNVLKSSHSFIFFQI